MGDREHQRAQCSVLNDRAESKSDGWEAQGLELAGPEFKYQTCHLTSCLILVKVYNFSEAFNLCTYKVGTIAQHIWDDKALQEVSTAQTVGHRGGEVSSSPSSTRLRGQSSNRESAYDVCFSSLSNMQKSLGHTRMTEFSSF